MNSKTNDKLNSVLPLNSHRSSPNRAWKCPQIRVLHSDKAEGGAAMSIVEDKKIMTCPTNATNITQCTNVTGGYVAAS